MDFISEIKWRGILNDITNEDKFNEAILKNKAAYIGFDPSADSLHLGNFVMMQMLNRLNKFGIKAYAVVGGATGMIGDPSGKSTERNLLDSQTVTNNKNAIKNQLETYCNVEVLDNLDIYKNMNFLDFLRDAGKLINVNYMLEKDSIKSRLETGISFTEFAYTLIQGFDFLQFYLKKDIAIQIGGSDQWGNITTGIEMIRKVVGEENSHACGFTAKLLTRSDGKKFGKSEKGAIFLDKNKTSVYEMYQFLINQNDDDVIKLLKFLTFLSKNEIEDLETSIKTEPHLKKAQKELAKEIVTQVHGITAYENVLRTSKMLFEGNILELNEQSLDEVFQNVTSTLIEQSEINTINLLVLANVVGSNRQARELVETNSIMINGQKVSNQDQIFTKKDLLFNKYLIIKKGKRNYFVCKWK